MLLQSQGNVMCLLRLKKDVPKGETLQEYGVLLQNLEDNSELGTCVMEDNRYLTLPRGNLEIAFKRIKEYAYIISDERRILVMALYNIARSDLTVLELRLQQCQTAYIAAVAAATIARTTAQDSSGLTKRPTGGGASHHGTHVAMFLKWCDFQHPQTPTDAKKIARVLD
jgi:hypothetical protein